MFQLPKSLSFHLCLILLGLALFAGVVLGYYFAEGGKPERK